MKHRIVGSLMLLSLAVIILPFWLDGAGLEDYQATQKQPAMPLAKSSIAFESSDTSIQVPNVDLSDTKVIELSPILTSKDSSTNTQASVVNLEEAKLSKPAVKKIKPQQGESLLSAKGLPNGWVVQIGSFGERSNAVRLKDKVIKAGFPAYMLPNGALFRVLVGPELSRFKAEVLETKLKNKFKVPTYVTLYKVEKP